MTGRGRGVVLSDILKNRRQLEIQGHGPQFKQHSANNVEAKPSSVSMLEKRPIKYALPVGGRGLMTPNQFMKTQPTVNSKTAARLYEEENLKRAICEPALSVHNAFAGTALINQEITKAPSFFHAKQATSTVPGGEQAEADANWHKFKFQRQISKILANASPEEVEDIFMALKSKLNECSLSSTYPQFSEMDLVLESLIDKSTQSENFLNLSITLVTKVAEYDITQFKVTFPSLISKKISEYVQVTASSRKIAVIAQRFCNLLGLIFRSAFESKNDIFQSVMAFSFQECLQQWTYPNAVGSEMEGFNLDKAETNAYAAMELFKAMELQNITAESVDQLMNDLEDVIRLLKETVINESLPRKIREVYLTLMLVYTPRWQYLKQGDRETGISNDVSSYSHSSLSESTDVSVDEMKTNDCSLSPDASYFRRRIGPRFDPTDGSSQGFNGSEASDWRLSDDSENHDDDYSDICGSLIIESIETEEKEIEEEESISHRDRDVCRVSDVNYQQNSEVVCAGGEGTTDENGGKGSYHSVEKMLKQLQLDDQIQRFKDNFIRDTVLKANREDLEVILKEASFPAGVVYEILSYLDQSKSKNENSVEYHTQQGPFVTSEFRFQSIQDPVQQKVHVGSSRQPKQRLHGLGRGRSESEARNRSPASPSSEEARKPLESSRRSAQAVNSQKGKNSEGEKFLHNDFEKKKLAEANSYRKSFKERNFLQETMHGMQGSGLKIGKVEPLPRRAHVNAENMASIKGRALAQSFGFGRGRPACLRCGEKGHLTHECVDSKTLFI